MFVTTMICIQSYICGGLGISGKDETVSEIRIHYEKKQVEINDIIYVDIQYLWGLFCCIDK